MIKNKYSLYKPSGINWIGDIPENWNTLKLKHEYKIQKGRIPKTIFEKMDKGLVPYLSMEVLRGSDISSFVSNDDGVIVKEGQILILWDGSNSGEIIKVEKDGILSSTMGVLNKIGNKLNENFSFYQLKSNEPEIRNNTNGMGIPHVNGQYIRSLVLLTPPLQEQEQIVKYLDEKTSIIDKLISTKERKIELLKEQRTSLINEVITKGLNPNVKMKDSGVEWIGEIPESWKIVNFSRVCSVRQGLQIPYEDRFFEKVEKSYEYITTQSVHNPERPKQYIYNPKPSVICNENDILMGRTGNTGEVVTNVNGVFHNNFFLIDFNRKLVNKEFLVWYLTNPRLREELLLLSGTTTIPDLNHGKFLSTKFCYPNLYEQQIIVEYLDKHTKEIDDLVSMEQNKIELLKEYRQSLISEVITGKIKVV